MNIAYSNAIIIIIIITIIIIVIIIILVFANASTVFASFQKPAPPNHVPNNGSYL